MSGNIVENSGRNSLGNGCSKSTSRMRRRIFQHTLDFCWNLISVGILLQIIANCGLGEGAIRNVTLVVEPPAVRRGQHATLKCLYDLQGAPLYSVKFYRGLREFYRFSPSEFPNNKPFPFPGIHVDMSLSNASQVVIRNVGFGLSGNFSCEVTADAPFFSTATGNVQLQVVELPEKRPSLWSLHDRYEPAEVLVANCSSPPSRPKTQLTLTVNNKVYPNDTKTQYMPTNDNLISTRISVRLHLQSSHFAAGNGAHGGTVQGGEIINSISPGGLLLRCTAQIDNLYQEYTELEVGAPQRVRDPIPARVTSSGASPSILAAGARGKGIFHITQSTIKINKLLAINIFFAIIAILHKIPSLYSS